MDIMKQRYEKTDKELAKLLIKIKKINKNTRDRIQDIFNGIELNYNNLFKWASVKEIAKFNRIIEGHDLSGSNGLKIKNLKGKKRIKNYQIIEALILLQEMDMMNKINGELTTTLDEIVKISYEQALKESKTKRRPRLADDFLFDLMMFPIFDNLIWGDYIDGLVGYNTTQIYKLMITYIQQNRKPNVDDIEFEKLFDKQVNGLLHKKETWHGDTPLYMDKYVGSIDALATYVINKTALQGYINAGVKEVLFVAEYDNKTTEMCKTLDGQRFKIDEFNYYNRYSATAGRTIRFVTEGLEIGKNLPPINDHFHWCRSTIIPVESIEK